MKEYQFKENKILIISGNIGLIIFLLGFVSLIVLTILAFFTSSDYAVYGLTCFLLSLPVALPFMLISLLFSKRNEFTSNFIKKIKIDLENAKTEKQLYNVFDKLHAEAVDENNMIRLSYPNDIKELFKEINYKLDILNKQK